MNAQPSSTYVLLQAAAERHGDAPALVIREIEDVVRRKAAGAVDVTNDAKRGLLAQVRMRGPTAPLRAALGRYAFAAECTEA